jgi:hypothetical protein
MCRHDDDPMLSGRNAEYAPPMIELVGIAPTTPRYSGPCLAARIFVAVGFVFVGAVSALAIGRALGWLG